MNLGSWSEDLNNKHCHRSSMSVWRKLEKRSGQFINLERFRRQGQPYTFELFASRMMTPGYYCKPYWLHRKLTPKCRLHQNGCSHIVDMSLCISSGQTCTARFTVTKITSFLLVERLFPDFSLIRISRLMFEWGRINLTDMIYRNP